MNEQPDNNSRVVTNAATGAATPGIPRAEIQAARKGLAAQAKIVQQAAVELEQLALIEEVPFEEAMVLPPEEVKKRYTAENARQIEWRREACIKLLARQVAAEDICDILKMNHRTVGAIASQEGQKIATFSNQFADSLASSAMSDLALAHTKRDSASYKDLSIGAGIKLTHAVNMKMVGAGGAEDVGALELEAENPALQSARKFLEMKKANATSPNSETQKPEEEGK
jgi:hypothetical protein